MNDCEFTVKILSYLGSEGKTVNQALLEEASKRAATAFRRQLMEDRESMPGELRMSSGGQCGRKQWHNFHGSPKEPISGRTVNTFLTGDLLEVGLSVLGRLAGWQLMGKPDGEDEIEIAGVKGHPDDLLCVPEENGEIYLVEYKTMSDYSYKKFESVGLDDQWGYFTQASLYCAALGVTHFILVAQCKSTGHLHDRVYAMRQDLVDVAKQKWEALRAGMELPRGFDAEPETVYNRKTKERDPTGRSILGITCSYCDFKNLCWPQAVVEFKSEKPIFVIPPQAPQAPV